MNFYELVKSQELVGMIEPIGNKELAIMLEYDFEDRSTNAFDYFFKLKGASARLAFEVRKSMILPFPADFKVNHPFDSVERVKKYRSQYVSQVYPGYKDENWQYEMLVDILFTEKQLETLEFVYERFVEDGNLDIDFYEDPWIELCSRWFVSDCEK